MSVAAVFLPPRVCLVPRLNGLGGPASFNRKLIEGLNQRGVQVSFQLNDPDIQAVLVNGGTRRFLAALWQTHRRGVRIVQRLDGMNWIHRKKNTGLAHFLRAETNNWVLALIRARMADALIYQSQFTYEWWNRVRGRLAKPFQIIHNAVDLNVFTPAGPVAAGPVAAPAGAIRVLSVEGHLRGGNEVALGNAIRFAQALGRAVPGSRVELRVLGDVPSPVRQQMAGLAGESQATQVTYAGVVPHEYIPAEHRAAHLFYSAELNAPCPNAVIEALASGLPVVGFQTGSLPELVPAGGGCLVAYGADPWSLQPPDVDGLAQASARLLADLPAARQTARRHAETAFPVDRMVDRYLDVLLERG